MIRELTDTEARIIASWYISPADESFTALATSGALLGYTDNEAGEVVYLVADARAEIARERSAENREMLRTIQAYARAHGVRGPVQGWSDLNWSSEDERALEASFGLTDV